MMVARQSWRIVNIQNRNIIYRKNILVKFNYRTLYLIYEISEHDREKLS